MPDHNHFSFLFTNIKTVVVDWMLFVGSSFSVTVGTPTSWLINGSATVPSTLGTTNVHCKSSRSWQRTTKAQPPRTGSAWPAATSTSACTRRQRRWAAAAWFVPEETQKRYELISDLLCSKIQQVKFAHYRPFVYLCNLAPQIFMTGMLHSAFVSLMNILGGQFFCSSLPPC